MIAQINTWLSWLPGSIVADEAVATQEVNLEVKAAAAGEQELKGECNSLRLAVDAARQAVAAKDAECMRLQQSLHSSRCELVELAAKHRCAGGYCTPACTAGPTLDFIQWVRQDIGVCLWLPGLLVHLRTKV